MTELETITVSFKAYRIQHDLIEEAASKNGQTISDFCRETLIERAANLTGRRLPTLPPLQRGRYGNMVAQAATKLGITRQEFEQRVVQEAAAKALGYTVLLGRDLPASSRKGSGTYARTDAPAETVTRPKRITGK